MSEPTLTPAAFAAKWTGVQTTEKASSQSHFLDLCRMLGEPAPHDADPIGQFFAFERPTWLSYAHEQLDTAVLEAYGWQVDITDSEILEHLLALNLERSME